MSVFCPNCEKETDCHFDAELYSCNKCGEDFANYEKSQVKSATKHMLELSAFLRKIVMLGLLRDSPRLRNEALRILDGVETLDFDSLVTQTGSPPPGDRETFVRYILQSLHEEVSTARRELAEIMKG